MAALAAMRNCPCLRWFKSLWASMTSRTIIMTKGLSVHLGKQIAEGGFSYVYLGWAGDRKFAIKKILCQTPEQVSGQTE